jgi:hypothetical protein
MKIGGTGFNLSPANFQKPDLPTTTPIFIVRCDVPSGGYTKIGGTGFNLSPVNFQKPDLPTTTPISSFVVTSNHGVNRRTGYARWPR